MKKPQPLQVICKMYVLIVVLLSLGTASSIQLGFLEGQRYTYNYQSEIIHSIPRSSGKALGLRMNSQVHADFFKNTGMQITLENVSFHQVTGNDQDPKQEEETAIDDKILKTLQLPFKVVFNGGRIKQISAHNQDHEWSINIKRGLANMFQIAPEINLEEEKDKQFLTQLESTVIGNCPVAYVISPDNNQPDKKDRSVKLGVSKLINYDQCKNRPELNRNIFYSQRCDDCQQSNGHAPYLSTIGRIDHTLISSNISGSVIDRTETYEEHIFTPFSRFGGEVKASARQVLQFKKIDAVGKALTDRTKKVSLQFTAEDPNKSVRGDVQLQTQIAQKTRRLIEEMQKAVKDPGSHQAAKTFTTLVQLLRHSNKDTLEKVANRMLLSQDPTERKYFLDVLFSVGTSEAFQVLKQKIQENRIRTKEELNRVFMGLAFASSPTAEHIKTVWELCRQQQGDASTRRQCLLSFGALVNKVNKRARLQQDTQTVAYIQKHVQEIQNYLANPVTSQQDRLTAIKVLGNAGSTQAQEQLLKIIKDRSESRQIRVNSIWALRRIISQAKDKIYPSLISTFSDTNESPELRMASVQLLLNSEPNLATLQSVTNIVRREITNQDPGPRSNQVASYVISLLSSTASNDNPVMKKRAMQARRALQLLPKTMFGLSYSKGIRWSHYAEKFQAGTEFEVNKMNVPESTIPRNMNARLMLNLFGYKTDVIEFGTRIENMDDTILEHLTPNVQRRKKRSLLGSALSWFKGSSNGKAKRGSLSTYIRVFGDELKFAEISLGQLDQLADDVTDLLSGRKDRLEFKDQGIVISKDKVTIQQALEKAILLNDARRMLPTMTGIPLDIQFTSSAVIKLIGEAKMNIGSSLWGLLPDISKIAGDVEIKPSVNAHADVSVGIHTPYLRMGLQLSGSASANPVHKLNFLNNAGTSRVRYDIPDERRDIVNVKTATQGFVERLNPVTYERDKQQISLDLSAPHLKQLQSIFTCQDKFGVQLCAEGQVPDIASLRLQEIPVLSAIGQTELRVSMGASTAKPTTIDWTNNIVKNNKTEVKVSGQISSSNTAQGRITYKATYRKEDSRAQLKIESNVFDVKGYKDWTVNFTANHDGLKLEFGGAKVQYQITASGQIQDQGKHLRLQTQWTELPEQWKTLFYNWQPQLWYALQQFACIRRTEQKTKQVSFELQLMTPVTANLTVKTPDAEAERANLALPIRIERIPQSPQDIFNNLYAQCEVTNQSITTFDELQYEHNIGGKCPHVLVQVHSNDKESKRMELSLLIDEKRQNWAVMASIYQKYNETVKIQTDLTILIDGSERECNQTVACQLKHSGATVQKTQTSDGTTQIQISTKLGLYVTIEGQRLQVYASPLLRNRVRGLCGDADGEQWNEYRDAQTDQVFTTLQEFTQSWQKTC